MVWISEGRSDIAGGLKAYRTVQVSDLSPDSWLIFRPLLCLCYEFFFVELVLAGCGLLRMAPVRTWFLFRLSLSWSASPSFSALSLYFFVMSSDMSLLDAVGAGWLWSSKVDRGFGLGGRWGLRLRLQFWLKKLRLKKVAGYRIEECGGRLMKVEEEAGLWLWVWLKVCYRLKKNLEKFVRIFGGFEGLMAKRFLEWEGKFSEKNWLSMIAAYIAGSKGKLEICVAQSLSSSWHLNEGKSWIMN